MSHQHWEFDSICPHCGKLSRGRCPVGERAVIVHCEHCTHSYDYVHIVMEHETVTDGD